MGWGLSGEPPDLRPGEPPERGRDLACWLANSKLATLAELAGSKSLDRQKNEKSQANGLTFLISSGGGI